MQIKKPRAVILLACICVVSLAGCAAIKGRQEVAAITQWAELEIQKAKGGQRKWSSFYTEYYGKVSDAKGLIHTKGIVMRSIAELIVLSKKYESGELTREEFESQRRLIEAQSQVEVDQVQMELIAAQKRAASNPVYVPKPIMDDD